MTTSTKMEMASDLARRGQLLEGGWLGMRQAVVPANAPPVQLREMRLAFFAGAQFLYSLLMHSISAGAEPTAEDLALMDAIRAELESFAEEHNARLAHQLSERPS